MLPEVTRVEFVFPLGAEGVAESLILEDVFPVHAVGELLDEGFAERLVTRDQVPVHRVLVVFDIRLAVDVVFGVDVPEIGRFDRRVVLVHVSLLVLSGTITLYYTPRNPCCQTRQG